MRKFNSIRPIFFASVFTLIPFLTNAQVKRDSLLQIWESAKHDTVRIRADIGLARLYETENFDSALYFYNRALSSANKKPANKYPFYKILVNDNLALAYIYSTDSFPKGLDLLREVETEYSKNNFISKAIQANFQLGYNLGRKHLYDSSVRRYERMILLNKMAGTEQSLAEAYNNAGLNNYYQGKFQKAIEYTLEGVRLKELLPNKAGVASSYLNLGLSYQNLKYYEKAKEYYKRAADLFEKEGSKGGLALSYKNRGDCLVGQDSLNRAEEHYNEAFKLYSEIEDGYGVSDYYWTIGQVQQRRGEYKEAEQSYLQAEATFPPRISDKLRAKTYSSIAEAKVLLVDSVYSDFSEQTRSTLISAKDYGEKAWLYASQIDALIHLQEASAALTKVYKRLDQSEKALEWAEKLMDVSSQMDEKAKADAIAKMAAEYDTERVDGENALLQESQKRQEAQLKQQQALIIGAVVILILIIAIAIVVQRSKLKLKKANVQVEKSLQEKELLLKEIHHRVKNNLQVVSSLLELQSREIEDEETQATFMEGQNRVKAMALIHQKLYQNENLATINFEDYANMLIGELGTIYNMKADVKTVVNGGLASDFDIDTAVPLGLILNELISNAYKYAFNGEEQGALSVSINSLGEGKHQLIVEDNGDGLPDSFDFQKAKSLGLRLVRRLAKQLYGSVEYSNIGGAKFVINFTDTLQRRAI
tara:strand:+ start:5696 stop:7810 length:2115 start_codon:yes stop_codon:yes gene_type:complete